MGYIFRFSHCATYGKIAKYEKPGKYLLMLYEATCDNYFLNKCFLKPKVARVILLTNCIELVKYNSTLTYQKQTLQILTLPGYISICIFQYEHFVPCLSVLYSLTFCNRFCFRMFCSKHSVTFENTYLLSFSFHYVDIFFIKRRFCKTITVINSVTRILLTETLYKFRTIRC